MKTPEEFLTEAKLPFMSEEEIKNTGFLHMPEIYRAMSLYASECTKEAVTEIYNEKEAECESLRQTLRDVINSGEFKKECWKCKQTIIYKDKDICRSVHVGNHVLCKNKKCKEINFIYC